ncbi:MAG: hypothetical protein ACE5KH_04055 [Candidatus Geothermarchaeales archaeon]
MFPVKTVTVKRDTKRKLDELKRRLEAERGRRLTSSEVVEMLLRGGGEQ